MPVSDFHNDVLTSPNAEALLEEYERGGNNIVCAFFKGSRTFAEALSVCRRFADDNKKNLYLSFEDISFTEDLSLIEALLDLRPVCASLTWNAENFLAGGARSDGRLTKKGRELIALMNERRIAVDLAHLNEASFFDVLDVAENVVCSHTCFFGVNEHFRNLKDEQISALAERKALIGLTFYRPFLTASVCSDVKDVIKHVEYFCERFPPELLCIGTDFNGCDEYPIGFSDYSFEKILRSSLSERGYEKCVTDGILYGNLSRFLTEKK